jgi:hypothetical protein
MAWIETPSVKVGKLTLGEIVSFVDDLVIKILRLLTREL